MKHLAHYWPHALIALMFTVMELIALHAVSTGAAWSLAR